MENLWEDFVCLYLIGSKIEGEIKNIIEFGLFVGLDGEVDGMVYFFDFDWE